MATITLSNIHKRYEDNVIINGLELTIQEDEFVAGFIGSPSMNLLSGKVDRESVVTDDGLRLPLANVPAGVQGNNTEPFP